MNANEAISSRRNFLIRSAAVAGASAIPGFGLVNSLMAQSAPDYKALVCVFQYGGNDGNNTVVPLSQADYGQYAAVRGSLAISQGNLAPLAEASGARYGLHPNLSPLQSVWNAGKMAVLFNSGPLVQPITRAEFFSNPSLRPDNVFSHGAQQDQWQTAISTQESLIGWGGRLTDYVANMNAGLPTPGGISVDGNSVFLVGNNTTPFAIPRGGPFGLGGFQNDSQDQARRVALDRLLQETENSKLMRAISNEFSRAITASALLSGMVNGSGSAITDLFPNLNAPIAQQMLRVARIIEGRGQLGLRRQIFLVGQGNYDTHGNQLSEHGNRMAELGYSLRAFYDAMGRLGMSNNVTVFTASDFGRTLKPNAAAGTDHAWGNHHFIMGGAVRGGYYGAFPSLALGGIDDSWDDGRWIPTTSVEQYGATLAQWFGVPAANLSSVFPNIGKFQNLNLGFLA